MTDGVQEIPTVKVLLVDDEEPAFLLVRRFLSKVPGRTFTVEWASTFSQGLAQIGEHRHDLYLLDYRLGAETGLDLLRQALALGVRAPIIMLTGTNDPKVDFEAAQIGAADFLVKDELNPVVLERAIRYALQHHATLTALQRSNERFRLLFERSMDAIIISQDGGRIVEANNAACQLFGVARERILELKWCDLPASSLLPHAHEEAEGGLGELTFTHQNGERRFVEYTTSQLAPNLKLTILRDVTGSRNLEREIQQISEREQRRLGQELHDGLGQALTGIGFMSKSLERKLASKGLAEAGEAESIATLIGDALAQTRRLARGLCPTELENNDIQSALEHLAENIKHYFSVPCKLQCSPDLKIADNDVAVHLYRIAQEAATNAIKHGKAKCVSIDLCLTGSRLVLRITDNGTGLPKEIPHGKGMGLRVMQYRARIIGGIISVRQPKEGGTIVTCSIRRSFALKRSCGETGLVKKVDLRGRRPHNPALVPA